MKKYVILACITGITGAFMTMSGFSCAAPHGQIGVN